MYKERVCMSYYPSVRALLGKYQPRVLTVQTKHSEGCPEKKTKNDNSHSTALTQAIENVTMECHHFNGDIK